MLKRASMYYSGMAYAGPTAGSELPLYYVA